MSKKRKHPRTGSKNSVTKSTDRLVYGESAAELGTTFAKAVRKMAETQDGMRSENGMTSIELVMEPEEAPAVLRAVMRAEAEMLLSDAEKLKPLATETRTSEQRQFDALIAVFAAVSKPSRDFAGR